MRPPLSPTIWRTCRVLAHEGRLRLLAEVCARDRASVSELARACELPANLASMQLRQLQSRGVVAVTRQGRWVYYEPRADRSVAHAAAMLAIVRRALRRGDSPALMLAGFTVFTHSRRILLVQALARTPLDATALTGRCHVSLPAAVRHLDKLRRRGVVVADKSGAYHLGALPPGLRRDLVRLILVAAK